MTFLKEEWINGEWVVSVDTKKLRSTPLDELMAYRPEDAIREAAAAQPYPQKLKRANGAKRG